MRGGGNPWDIPPFNWYGKGVINTINGVNGQSSEVPYNSNSSLDTIVDVSGKGALYSVTFSYDYKYNSLAFKIIIDDITILHWIPPYSPTSSTNITENHGLLCKQLDIGQYNLMSLTSQVMSAIRTVNNYKTGISFPLSSPYTSSSNIGIFYPLLFTKSLKIQYKGFGLTNISNFKFGYMYDLFDE